MISGDDIQLVHLTTLKLILANMHSTTIGQMDKRLLWGILICHLKPQRKASRPYSFEKIMLPLVAQIVKSLPAMWETPVRSLGQGDPLEEGMATHSSPLAWRIPWMEEPGGLQSMGQQRVRHDYVTNFQLSYSLYVIYGSAQPHLLSRPQLKE